MLQRELVSDAQDERPADWRAIYQLLHSGAYEQASALLQERHVASAATANRLELVAIDAMREICLACLQCQAEVEWHRRAEQAAEQREQQLNSHAQALLDWVSEKPLADSAEPDPISEPHLAEAAESIPESRRSLNVRNLIQRVKHLFVPEYPTPATPLTEEIGEPALSDSKPGETLDPRVEEEKAQAEPASPAFAVEPETPDELAPITPLSTEGAEAELEPALPEVVVSEEPQTPVVSAPHAELAPITPLSTEVAEAEREPALPEVVVSEEPQTPIVSAPHDELAPITPLSTEVAETEQEPASPAFAVEPETPIVSAPHDELAPITPLSTEVAEAEREPALPEVVVSEEPEMPIVSIPHDELPAITPLSTQVAEAELEPALPPVIGEPETPAVSVLPATAQHAPELYTMAIYCFGPFRVYQRHQLIEEWNGLRGQAVLKYLVARRGTPIAKDVLMDVFWPDADAEAARRNLHQAIYSLRQTLRRRAPAIQHIQFENNQYVLNPALSVWIDVEEFQTHVQSGRRLEAAGQLAAAMVDYGTAEGLYQGDFLEEDLYDEWSRPQRERLRTTYLDIADRLSEYCRQRGEYSAAIALCQKILTLDNCVEEAHRRLMRCYLAQGQRHLAVRQYHTCVRTLAKELDVPPDDETRKLYASISTNS